LIIPSTAYADEQVTTVIEGQAAPFDGTLFNTEAAARLLSDLTFSEEACQIQIERATEGQQAQCQLQLDILQASKDAIQMRYEETLVVRDDHIQYLEKQLTKPKIPQELSFVLGVVAGIGITLGTAFAMSEIVKSTN
tara:strand:+ start:190 stop:600 length:411 start_codon:yes stop_codon:yes gene_type:complete